MRKIYIAKRIASNIFEDAFIKVSPQNTIAEIEKLYASKIIKRDKYIHNGQWILRPVINENLDKNNLPKELRPNNILDMVINKIKTSDAFVAIIDTKSYGAIIEIGYAVALNTCAVYVLFDINLKQDEISDLWMSIHLSRKTSTLWRDEDIKAILDFTEREIFCINDYINYIESVVPLFLKD